MGAGPILHGLLDALVAPDLALELVEVVCERRRAVVALDALRVVIITRELLVGGRLDAFSAAVARHLRRSAAVIS